MTDTNLVYRIVASQIKCLAVRSSGNVTFPQPTSAVCAHSYMETGRFFACVVGVNQVCVRMNLDFCIFAGIAEPNSSVSGITRVGHFTCAPCSC